MSPLVADCPTFRDATRTLEYLCSAGLPAESLSIVADGLRLAPEDVEPAKARSGSGIACGVLAGSGFALGFTVDGFAAGLLLTAMALLLGALSGWRAPRDRGVDHADAERVIARRYYLVSDHQIARRARRLVREATAGNPQLLPGATPCVGFLPGRPRPSPPPTPLRRWNRWLQRSARSRADRTRA